METAFIVYFQINGFIALFLKSFNDVEHTFRVLYDRTQSNPRNSLLSFFFADGQRLYVLFCGRDPRRFYRFSMPKQREYGRFALLISIAVSLFFLSFFAFFELHIH